MIDFNDPRSVVMAMVPDAEWHGRSTGEDVDIYSPTLGHLCKWVRVETYGGESEAIVDAWRSARLHPSVAKLDEARKKVLEKIPDIEVRDGYFLSESEASGDAENTGVVVEGATEVDCWLSLASRLAFSKLSEPGEGDGFEIWWKEQAISARDKSKAIFMNQAENLAHAAWNAALSPAKVEGELPLDVTDKVKRYEFGEGTAPSDWPKNFVSESDYDALLALHREALAELSRLKAPFTLGEDTVKSYNDFLRRYYPNAPETLALSSPIENMDVMRGAVAGGEFTQLREAAEAANFEQSWRVVGRQEKTELGGFTVVNQDVQDCSMGYFANPSDAAFVALATPKTILALLNRLRAPGVKGETGADLIAAERLRQVEREGWTAEHDSTHQGAELTRAAMSYADSARRQIQGATREYGLLKPWQSLWPWDDGWWKPSFEPIPNLVKAGALIAAEIDRLKRVPSPPSLTAKRDSEEK